MTNQRWQLQGANPSGHQRWERHSSLWWTFSQMSEADSLSTAASSVCNYCTAPWLEANISECPEHFGLWASVSQTSIIVALRFSSHCSYFN